MKVKPFYCKTEGLTPQRVQDVLDNCVGAGAIGCEWAFGCEPCGVFFHGPCHIKSFCYFGVRDDGRTFFYDDSSNYGDSVELTYDQIDEHLGLIPTETAEEKEALDAIKPVEWDGVGWPPVGVECEWIGGGHAHGDWGKVVVLAYFNDFAWISKSCSDDPISVYKPAHFRPIETPQQREERERLEAAKYLLDGNPQSQLCQWDDARVELKEHLLWIVDETGYRKVSDA